MGFGPLIVGRHVHYINMNQISLVTYRQMYHTITYFRTTWKLIYQTHIDLFIKLETSGETQRGGSPNCATSCCVLLLKGKSILQSLQIYNNTTPKNE